MIFVVVDLRDMQLHNQYHSQINVNVLLRSSRASIEYVCVCAMCNCTLCMPHVPVAVDDDMCVF